MKLRQLSCSGYRFSGAAIEKLYVPQPTILKLESSVFGCGKKSWVDLTTEKNLKHLLQTIANLVKSYLHQLMKQIVARVKRPKAEESEIL